MIEFKKQKRVIDRFRGAYSFLSNFSRHSVRFERITYPTAEHAYQAQKAWNPELRLKIAAIQTPGMAKCAGAVLDLREDWEDIKLEIMEQVVLAKFLQNAPIRLRLLETGDVDLIEDNNWGDSFWGVCDGRGQNYLGKILMKIRSKIHGKS